MQEEGGKPELCNRTFSVNSAYGRVELIQSKVCGRVKFFFTYTYIHRTVLHVFTVNFATITISCSLAVDKCNALIIKSTYKRLYDVTIARNNIKFGMVAPILPILRAEGRGINFLGHPSHHTAASLPGDQLTNNS